LREQGELAESAHLLQSALQLKPDHAAAHNNLENALKDEGNLDQAIACYHRAIELKPDFAEAQINLGNAFKDKGDLEEAMACHRRALELIPNYAVARSNLLYTLHYRPGVTLAALAVAHAGYDRQHVAPHSRGIVCLDNVPRNRDRLRLGFISADLARHPVGYFLVRALENLSKDQVDTTHPRLVLKYAGMDDPTLAGRLAKTFADHAVDPGRVAFLGKSPHPESLAHYHGIDIALDPFPYKPGLTTCEALWMGVPVITCPGETFAGRHSLTHLSNVGLTQTIADDWDEYVDLAVSLADDLLGLAAMRAGLREKMAASPLCDGK
jgi:predicted O-linked N-acetylglucosamine transferase (SPINDLY family)